MNQIKLTVLSFFLLVCFCLQAQKTNIQNAWSALNFKELDKAKKAIDLAAEHEDTKNNTKMWLYRGKIYLAINDSNSRGGKYKDLDPDAAEKAVISFTNCLKGDKDNIYKDEATPLLVQSCIRLYNRGKEAYYQNHNYEKAVSYYTDLFDALPFDKDKSLVRSNITFESINNELFKISKFSGNNTKAKEYLQKLIDVKYKDPSLYIEMSRILLLEKDTSKALSYVETGRNLFDDNADLIKAEINLYIIQNKMDELLEKTSKAIVSAPDNEMLYYIQGIVYKDKGLPDKAEASYKKAIEVKPDYFEANYELGALYFNKGVEWNNKSNNLPASQLNKAKEYDANAAAEFKKAVPYLEKAMEVNEKDRAVLMALKQLYARTRQDDKLQQINEKLKTK